MARSSSLDDAPDEVLKEWTEALELPGFDDEFEMGFEAGASVAEGMLDAGIEDGVIGSTRLFEFRASGAVVCAAGVCGDFD